MKGGKIVPEKSIKIMEESESFKNANKSNVEGFIKFFNKCVDRGKYLFRLP